MSLLTSLVSYWKFDESSGNAADSYGVNTLTNNNTATYTTGIINNGTDLEASSSQSFSIADASQVGLDLTGSFSASFWINPETISGGANAVFSKFNQVGSTGAYNLSTYTSGVDFRLFSSGSLTSKQWAYTFLTGTWYHLCIIYTASSGSALLYINGVSQGVVTGLPNSIDNSSVPFAIGGYSAGGGGFFDGIIDEVAIWSRELVSNEVTLLYSSGSGRAFSTFGYDLFSDGTRPTASITNTSRQSSTITNQSKP